MLRRISPPYGGGTSSGAIEPPNDDPTYLRSRRIVVIGPGALFPRDYDRGPPFAWAAESGVADEVYSLSLPHTYWYSRDSSDKAARSLSERGQEHHATDPALEREFAEQDARDYPPHDFVSVLSLDEACTMIKAALYPLLRQPFGHLCLIPYSLSTVFTVHLWSDLKRVVAHHHRVAMPLREHWHNAAILRHPMDCLALPACGCRKLSAIMIGAGLWVPDWKVYYMGAYFVPEQLLQAGRLERLHAMHGSDAQLLRVLKSIRSWPGGVPSPDAPVAGLGASLFSPDHADHPRYYRDPSLSFVCGINDLVFELENIWIDVPLPEPAIIIYPQSQPRHVEDGLVANQINGKNRSLWYIDGDRKVASSPQTDQAGLYLVPGDHFEVRERANACSCASIIHNSIPSPLPLVLTKYMQCDS